MTFEGAPQVLHGYLYDGRPDSNVGKQSPTQNGEAHDIMNIWVIPWEARQSFALQNLGGPRRD